MPHYFLGREIERVDAPPELQRIVFDLLYTSSGLRQRLVEVMERRRSPLEAIPKLGLLRGAGIAALRGRWGVLDELRMSGSRALAMTREVRVRDRMLADAERRLAREGRAAA